MNSADFTAYVLAKEINLNTLAQHFGMNKKYRWEDPLVLKDVNLSGVINNPTDKYVYIFYFGSLVFINFTHHEMMDVVKYLRKMDVELNDIAPYTFQDDFKLISNRDKEFTVNFASVNVESFNNYHLEIVSTILAKSVALEKIESDMNKLFDDIEDIIDLLDKGRFNISDRLLAKTSARILRYKFNSISYIMLLDKPDITWVDEEAGNIYAELGRLFELEERYQVVFQKSETLMDITQSFAGLTHATRGTRLEWMIIILIAFEIVLTLLDKFINSL